MNQGNYKAYNVIQHMRYWEWQGEDPAFLFKDTGIDYQKIMETDWFDFETQVFAVWKNLFRRVPDPESHFSIGYDSYKNRSMGVLDTIGRLASLDYIFKHFPILAKRYSTIERFETHQLNSMGVVMLYWPSPEFVSFHSLYQQWFLRGFFSAIPKIYSKSERHSIPDANVAVEFSCVDLSTIFTMNYNHLIPDAHCEYNGDLFLVDGKHVARKILLSVDENANHRQKLFFTDQKNSRIYCAKEGNVIVNLPNQLGREGFAYKVIDDFEVNGKKILSRGEVYNAPYTRYNISWQKIPFSKRVRFFLSERPKLIKNSKEQLVTQLEIADKRYKAEMEARKLAEEKEEEARRIKEELEKSEAQYRLLADNISDTIWVLELDTLRFSYVSPSISGIIGFTSEEATGFSWEDTLTPSSLALANKVLEEELIAASQNYHPSRSRILELEQYHKSGSTVWIEMVMKFIYNQKQQPTAVLGVSRDISERKKLQDQLLKSQKMESLGLLAGGVAHDLNNVLSGIVSYPELILMDLPPDSILIKPMMAMMESGNRAVAIVQDLLTIARGVTIIKEPLKLNDMVSEYLSSPEFRELKHYYPGVTFKTRLDEDLFNIEASDIHIRKVIMNLVSNAAEAVKENGNVSIKTENRYIDKPLNGYEQINIGEYIVLTITDDGSGISSKDLMRIFEPFYTKKKVGRSGTGLGLSVVWNVVRDHKGFIDVKSAGHETMFEVYFPITREAILQKADSLSVKKLRGLGETILVVDDMAIQREITCKMMEKLGYNCKSVPSGEKAAQYLQDHQVDLVLLDMIMEPGMNGFETYKKIIKIHPGQKTIILSGFSETDEVKKTQSLGAGKYLKKPISIEKLGVAVKEELNK